MILDVPTGDYNMRLATSDILTTEVVSLLNERNISYNPLRNCKSELAFTTEGHAKREFEIEFMAAGTYRISTRYLGYRDVMNKVCGEVFCKNDSDNTRKLFYVNIPNENKVNELLVRMLIDGFTTSPSIEHINSNTFTKVRNNNRLGPNNYIFTERDANNRSTLFLNKERIGRVHFRKNDVWLNPSANFQVNIDEIERLGLRIEKNPNSKDYPIKIYVDSTDETTIASILSQVLCHKDYRNIRCVEVSDVLENKDPVVDDATYLSEIDKYDGDDVFQEYIPRRTPRPESIKIAENSKYKRDVTAARFALRRANFKCEFDNNHASFIRATKNETYMEPHHLIPLSQQELFEFSLDVPANIVSLCSTCHNCIHYGKDSYILIEKLYVNRKDELEKAGIFVSLAALKRMYQ